MILEDIIRPDSVLCNVAARSKKHCLEILSELLTRPNPDIANEEAFAEAVDRVTAVVHDLLDQLVTQAPPKNREEEAAKARARAAKRFATNDR